MLDLRNKVLLGKRRGALPCTENRALCSQAATELHHLSVCYFQVCFFKCFSIWGSTNASVRNVQLRLMWCRKTKQQSLSTVLQFCSVWGDLWVSKQRADLPLLSPEEAATARGSFGDCRRQLQHPHGSHQGGSNRNRICALTVGQHSTVVPLLH